MIPWHSTFNERDSYEWDGKTVRRWYYLKQLGDYNLRFKIIATNSEYKQGIALFFSSDFKGTVMLNGERLPNLKGSFKHYIFKEGEFPNNEFTLNIHTDSGHLFWANASEKGISRLFDCGAFSYAFWQEMISENHFRFHCNDHEYDNDFDDLIFDMETSFKSLNPNGK